MLDCEALRSCSHYFGVSYLKLLSSMMPVSLKFEFFRMLQMLCWSAVCPISHQNFLRFLTGNRVNFGSMQLLLQIKNDANCISLLAFDALLFSDLFRHRPVPLLVLEIRAGQLITLLSLRRLRNMRTDQASCLSSSNSSHSIKSSCHFIIQSS